jgi:hypothetical protein
MPKPFSNPYWTANRALTNLLSDLEVQIEDWGKEREGLAGAISFARELEHDWVFLPKEKAAVHVWTGLARLMNRIELREWEDDKKAAERERLFERLKELDRQREEMNEKIKKFKEGTDDRLH